MSDRFDVVVVGAGPAGASAAISIRRHRPDASVLLLDKAAAFPRDKVCGDGLGPGVASVCAELGVASVLAHEPILDEVVVRGPAGVTVATPLPEIRGERVHGHVLPRTEFDARLVEQAVAHGATLRTGVRATATRVVDGGREITVDGSTGTETIVAPLVIGADGANSMFRRALGARTPGPRTTGIAVRAYAPYTVSDQSLRHSLLFEFSERFLPAYAWWFPGPNGVANVGLGLPVADLRARHFDLKGALAEFNASLAESGIESGTPTNIRTYTLPTGARLPRLAHDYGVLIGDAAAMINPLSGEGIFYGMAAGAMLGRAYAVDAPLDERLRRFERAFRRRFRRHYVDNFITQQLLRSPAWTARAVVAASRHPKVLSDAVNLMFGEGHLTLGGTYLIAKSFVSSQRKSRINLPNTESEARSA